MTPSRLRLAALLTAAGMTVATSGCGLDILRTTSTDEEKLDQTVNSIEFDLDSGDVTVSTGEESKVSRTIRHAGDLPEASHSLDDGILTLDRCPDPGCDIDYTVVVGPDARVQGKSGSGDITVTGLASVVTETGSGDTHLVDLASTAEATSGSGDVTLDRIGGETRARVGSGDILATGAGGTLDAETSSGSVDLSLAVAASVSARSGSGDVSVTVPDGPYRVTTEAGSGDVTNDLSSDDSAEFAIAARTGSGDIHLRHP